MVVSSYGVQETFYAFIVAKYNKNTVQNVATLRDAEDYWQFGLKGFSAMLNDVMNYYFYDFFYYF